MTAKNDKDLNLSPRAFEFAGVGAEAETATQVILDGQQRITAGIQLFHASTEQGTHYFVDVDKLQKLFEQYAGEIGVLVSDLLKDDTKIEAFIERIDTDDGYIRATPRAADPYARLNSHHLLFTPLLLAERDRDLEAYLDVYFGMYPDRKSFVRNVIKPYFQIKDSPLIPFIQIENTDMQGLSRIFATLNTTGKLLTPFELVVAILYPQGVDLRVDIREAKSLYPTYFPNMDRTGEIALQTCVLFDGGDPKKSLLPKTLTGDLWNREKTNAFIMLDRVGNFLKTKLGFPLDYTWRYTPYDSIFAPLAFVFRNVDFAKFGQTVRKRAEDRLAQYVIASSLVQRYQEGVHNKQKTDALALALWIKSDDDSKRPAWIQEAVIPSLKRVAPSGAIGKTILSLLNRNMLRDPITEELVPLGSPLGEDHHIFPTKFVPTLPGWDPQTHSANVVLNIMRVTKQTNAEYLNSDPGTQFAKAESANAAKLDASLRNQAISKDSLAVLRQSTKTATEFHNFIRLREQTVQKLINEEFKFPISAAETETDEPESET